MSLWVYRGEGNAHIVVSHKQKHIVYRMFKKKKNGILTRKKFKSDYQHLREKVLKYLAFTTNVMLPRIDRKYLHCGSLVEISQSLAQNIKASLENRPEYRKDKELDENCPYVVEMPDYCHVNQNSALSNCCNTNTNHSHNKHTQPVYTIEIKPKWGFLPTTECISSANKIKHSVCRYCMHQHQKIATGKWKHHSYYCPLDLFSGNKDRMKHALHMMFASPQNNLRIFKDGKALWNDQLHEMTNSEERFLREFGQRNDADGPQDLKTVRRQFDCFLDLLVQSLLHNCSTKPEEKPSGPAQPAQPSPLPAQPATQPAQPAAQANDCSTTSLSVIPPAPTNQRQALVTQSCAASSYRDWSGQRSTKGTVSPLPRGCVLYQILRTQLMDDIDIEGIEPLYRHVQGTMATTNGHNTSHNSGHSLKPKFDFNGPYDANWCPDVSVPYNPVNTTQYAVRKIKEFLVSRSAKDCSVMISLKPAPEHHPRCTTNVTDARSHGNDAHTRPVLAEASPQEPSHHGDHCNHGNSLLSDHCNNQQGDDHGDHHHNSCHHGDHVSSHHIYGHHGDIFNANKPSESAQSASPEPTTESTTESIQRSNHTNFLARDRHGQRHLVNIAVIDLDPKPFDRIESYIEEDREVVRYYMEYLRHADTH